MTTTPSGTMSLWMADKPVETEILEKNQECDVCIIGAGIAGISTAYLLSQQGKKVIVVDDGSIGSGETGRTTAHLANALDDRYYELEKMRGEKISRLAAESHTAAINTIEKIIQAEHIQCDFSRLDGYLFLSEEDSIDTLQEELAAAHRAGLGTVEQMLAIPDTTFHSGPCLRFPQQGQFHPLKYIQALAEIIKKNNGQVYTTTHVSDIEAGSQINIHTTNGLSITAEHCVIATNSPIYNRTSSVHTKQAPYRTYAIAARLADNSMQPVLFWDTEDPYHYVRLQDKYLIIGGEDHKSGQADDYAARYERLEQWARSRFPMMQEVVYRWSGQVMETFDGLAFIGREKQDENIYIVTGDSGMGMTHGTIGGLLITDLIMKRHNPWAEVYDPTRLPLKAGTELVKENINVAHQYMEWVSPGDVKNSGDIKPNSGAVIRHGLKKVAVYKDQAGKTHSYSAVCPHLGCIVGWNDGEKSWDCPCHGSRFDAQGKVLNGPTISDLKPADKK